MANNTVYTPIACFTESVSQYTLTNSVALGTPRHEGGREYIYVYNGTDNQNIRPGRGFRLASGSTGYTIDAACAAPSTCSAWVCFGVNAHATVPTAGYFWALQRGHATLEQLPAASAVVAGNTVYLTTSGTFAYCNTATTGDMDLLFGQVAGRVTVANALSTNTNSFQAYVNTTGNY